MASAPTIDVRVQTTGLRGTRYFYARPCDEPAKGWCVAEVEFSLNGCKWRSTLYEPALSKIVPRIGRKPGQRIAHIRMDKQQAKREANLWNRCCQYRGCCTVVSKEAHALGISYCVKHSPWVGAKC